MGPSTRTELVGTYGQKKKSKAAVAQKTPKKGTPVRKTAVKRKPKKR